MDIWQPKIESSLHFRPEALAVIAGSCCLNEVTDGKAAGSHCLFMVADGRSAGSHCLFMVTDCKTP